MIRKFENKDLSEIMKIWIQANNDAHSFISSNYWMCQFDNVKHLIPQAEVYVSENSGLINGFIGIMDSDIAGLFVNKSNRSLGIGTQLLNTVKTKKDKLNLSVYVKNELAIHFYEKEGFHIATCRIDTNTGEKEYIMHWACSM